jgi:alkanesulfonate monooxygenase SsuD/methylene tetrahydromethanopterin reductase-like flavin-dependent oxidoreductase (luciferase family)
VGESIERRHRAELLDEGLEIIAGLWSGAPLSFRGRHYQVEMPALELRPVQRPRIPIWVVGAWGSRKSMSRAFRYDGWLPANVRDDWPTVAAYLEAHRSANRPFDFVVEGRTPGDDRAKAEAIVQPFAQAGATWWLETMWEPPNGADDVRTRIRQGPPRG